MTTHILTGRHRHRRSARSRTAAQTSLMLAALLLAIAVADRVLPNGGEPTCTERDKVVAGLTTLFGEAHRAEALAGGDSRIEIFSSDTSGSWTLLRTFPDGRSCVLATGRGGWEMPTQVPSSSGLDV